MNAIQVANKIQEVFQQEKILDRRTIYAHFTDLEDISRIFEQDLMIRFERNLNKTVYMESIFSNGEAHLLCDAIATSRFIDKEKSVELISKFGMLIGEKLKSHYAPRLEFKNAEKKEYNDMLFENIGVLTEAIRLEKKVTLQYLKFNVDKNLIPMRAENNGYKKIRPYYLIWQINQYYLMYYYDDSTSPRFMRVDKMKDVKIINEKVERLQNISNLSDYTRNQVYMFGGMPTNIQFRCKMGIIGQVIDFFGEDAMIKALGEDYFQVELRTSTQSIKYWLLQYITSIDKIRPRELAVEMQELLEEGLRRNRVID